MKAVILAAGAGGRLRGVTGNRPKCLARIGALTLIERQLDCLRSHDIHDITVVVGFKAADVQSACGPSVSFVHNTQHASTNSLYSLWLARTSLTGGFLVMNCDVLFHPQLLTDLLTARFDDAALVCARGVSEPYSDEEMKVQVRRGLIVDIDKALDDESSDGENIGIAKFGAAGASALLEQIDTLVDAGRTGEWLPRAFQAFCRTRPLHAIDSRGCPWIEIDVPEDYWRACSDVLPAIEDPSPCMNASTTFANVRSR